MIDGRSTIIYEFLISWICFNEFVDKYHINCFDVNSTWPITLSANSSKILTIWMDIFKSTLIITLRSYLLASTKSFCHTMPVKIYFYFQGSFGSMEHRCLWTGFAWEDKGRMQRASRCCPNFWLPAQSPAQICQLPQKGKNTFDHQHFLPYKFICHHWIDRAPCICCMENC